MINFQTAFSPKVGFSANSTTKAERQNSVKTEEIEFQNMTTDEKLTIMNEKLDRIEAHSRHMRVYG